VEEAVAEAEAEAEAVEEAVAEAVAEAVEEPVEEAVEGTMEGAAAATSIARRWSDTNLRSRCGLTSHKLCSYNALLGRKRSFDLRSKSTSPSQEPVRTHQHHTATTPTPHRRHTATKHILISCGC